MRLDVVVRMSVFCLGCRRRSKKGNPKTKLLLPGSQARELREVVLNRLCPGQVHLFSHQHLKKTGTANTQQQGWTQGLLGYINGVETKLLIYIICTTKESILIEGRWEADLCFFVLFFLFVSNFSVC